MFKNNVIVQQKNPLQWNVQVVPVQIQCKGYIYGQEYTNYHHLVNGWHPLNS